MLHHRQMERDSPCDGPDCFIVDDYSSELTNGRSSEESSRTTHASTSSTISDHEFSCHCCYDILVNPTTLNCGHNFCRHCLALWWESSRKTECPECRDKWEGFPKVNILLRDAADKFFSEIVQRRRAEIQADPKISSSLLAFQRYGDTLRRPRTNQHRGAGCFFSGVLTALTCVAAMLLVYHWSSGEGEQHDLLISKPVTRWTTEEVLSWLEHLGPWAQLYREPFQQENVNGRLLLMLGEKELSSPNFNIENQAHRQAILFELDRVKTLGLKPPQNLWEYKINYFRDPGDERVTPGRLYSIDTKLQSARDAVNPGKSLFLLYALKNSPRLTLFYLYLFDYSETFLPFLHTCCPAVSHTDQPMENSLPLVTQSEPTWHQWFEFLVKYFLLPYQLIAEFAWDWLLVHYWSSRFIIVNAMLLSVLEVCALWRLWKGARIRTLPSRMWSHLWKIASQGFAFALLWPLIPQFVCNCLFYWALYFNPIINIDLVVQQLLYPETQLLQWNAL